MFTSKFYCWEWHGMKQKKILQHFPTRTIKFPYFFQVGTFIDSTLWKLYSPSKYSPPAAMLLLYRFNNFWKAQWKCSCVSVYMTFVKASFISSIVS